MLNTTTKGEGNLLLRKETGLGYTRERKGFPLRESQNLV